MKKLLASHYGWILLPASLLGQDTRVLGDAMDHFKGMADDVRKNNPVLAVGTGAGVGKFVTSLTGRRQGGRGAVQIDLPKQQQEELERRQKARERAELLAKTPRRRAVAAPAKPIATVLPPIPFVVMQAILYPVPVPPYTLIREEDLTGLSPGQERAAVLAALGKPSSVGALTGLEDGTREVFTYHLDPARTVSLRLHDGRLTAISRN